MTTRTTRIERLTREAFGPTSPGTDRKLSCAAPALLISAVAAVLLLLSPSRAAPLPPAKQVVTYEHAVKLYQKHDWSRAFGQFSTLAESGHQESARIALFMLQHGPQLYGTAWSSSQPQIAGWMKVSKTSMAMFEADGGD